MEVGLLDWRNLPVKHEVTGRLFRGILLAEFSGAIGVCRSSFSDAMASAERTRISESISTSAGTRS
jgi:hypothetical protein